MGTFPRSRSQYSHIQRVRLPAQPGSLALVLLCNGLRFVARGKQKRAGSLPQPDLDQVHLVVESFSQCGIEESAAGKFSRTRGSKRKPDHIGLAANSRGSQDNLPSPPVGQRCLLLEV